MAGDKGGALAPRQRVCGIHSGVPGYVGGGFDKGSFCLCVFFFFFRGSREVSVGVFVLGVFVLVAIGQGRELRRFPRGEVVQ